MTQFGVVPRVTDFFLDPGRHGLVRTIAIVPPSAPRQNPRAWTEVEISILRRFADQGTAKLHDLLPGRTPSAIVQRARKLGISIPWIHGTGYKMPSRRGNIPIPDGVHPIVRRFIREANRQRMTLEEVTKRSGLGRGAINGWLYGWQGRRRMPQLDTITAALNVLGLDLRVVPKATRRYRARVDEGNNNEC